MKTKQIIEVAEVWARNQPGTKRTTIKVLKADGGYYYLTYWGDKSTFYRSLGHAIHDIDVLYGDWIDYKRLV